MPPRGPRRYFVNHGPRHHKRVALTFDDGPCAGSTEALLDTLRELETRATFFCVGVNSQLNPALVRRIDAEGHDVGNHSYAHRRSGALSMGDTQHITMGADEIRSALGKTPALYRPPWGWLTPWEGRRLSHLGYTTIGWDVYTVDWKLPEPDAVMVADDAYRDTKPGSILAFHDAFPLREHWDKTVTIEAVRLLVPRLKRDGYRFVTVSELLGIHAYRESSPNDDPGSHPEAISPGHSKEMTRTHHED
jgi:peptidoglycan/xylan/chitin deacetylase (PgdA/CDA1 family)